MTTLLFTPFVMIKCPCELQRVGEGPMQPSDGTKPTIQDSVVGRDMHTGNVIHNHYHLPPAPQPVQQPPPQTVIYSPNPPQGAPYQHNPQQVFIPYKKIHATDWIIFGVLAIILGMIPGLNFVVAWLAGSASSPCYLTCISQRTTNILILVK